MNEIMQGVILLDQRQRRRDVREVVISAGAAGVILITLLWAAEPWFRALIMTLSATAALVAVWRYVTLFRRRSRSITDALASFCRSELSRLDNEIRLQRTLVWWYLTPILVGTNLYVGVSSEAPMASLAFFFPISAVAVVAIALVTRRSLRTTLLPLRAELSRSLAELTGNDGT